MTLIYIGADPGKGGAIAWVHQENDGKKIYSIGVAVMPETDVELHELVCTLKCKSIFSQAVIEKVSAGGTRTGEGKARMGVTSAFTFGQQVGRLHMAFTAAGIPYDVASPQRWQSALGCMTKGDKHVSKRRAEQLFPGVKVTLKNADALLLAEYCRRLFGNGKD